MKNHFKLLVTLAGFALAATPFLRADDTTAPTPPPAGQSGGRHGRADMRERFQRMAKELNLTPDQQTKGEAILKQGAESIKALRDDTTLSQEDKRAKMKQLREGIEQQIRAILTPEQQAKAKEMRQEHRQQGEPPPPPPPADKPTT